LIVRCAPRPSLVGQQKQAHKPHAPHPRPRPQRGHRSSAPHATRTQRTSRMPHGRLGVGDAPRLRAGADTPTDAPHQAGHATSHSAAAPPSPSPAAHSPRALPRRALLPLSTRWRALPSSVARLVIPGWLVGRLFRPRRPPPLLSPGRQLHARAYHGAQTLSADFISTPADAVAADVDVAIIWTGTGAESAAEGALGLFCWTQKAPTNIISSIARITTTAT